MKGKARPPQSVRLSEWLGLTGKKGELCFRVCVALSGIANLAEHSCILRIMMNELPNELARALNERSLRKEARLARLSLLGECQSLAEFHPKPFHDRILEFRSLLRRVCARFAALVLQERREQ